MAKWAAQTIELGQPGLNLVPFVLGPGSLPPTIDSAKPELAILSTLLHAEKLDSLQVKGALVAAGRLDPAQETMYVDLILRVVEKAAPQILEAVMSISADGYEFKSEFALKYLRQGREEGREEGRAEAILSILDERGLEVLDAQREAILATTDRATLDQLLRLAISAASTEDLLRAVPPAKATEGP